MKKHLAPIALLIGIFTALVLPMFLYATFLCFVPVGLGSLTVIIVVGAAYTESRLCRYVGWIAFVNMVLAIAIPSALIAFHN
jgi:hypothetical protein